MPTVSNLIVTNPAEKSVTSTVIVPIPKCGCFTVVPFVYFEKSFADFVCVFVLGFAIGLLPLRMFAREATE